MGGWVFHFLQIDGRLGFWMVDFLGADGRLGFLSDGRKPVVDGIPDFWGNNYLIKIQKDFFSLNSMGFFLYLME